MVQESVNAQTRGASHLSEMVSGYESKGGAYLDYKLGEPTNPLGRLSTLVVFIHL